MAEYLQTHCREPLDLFELAFQTLRRVAIALGPLCSSICYMSGYPYGNQLHYLSRVVQASRGFGITPKGAISAPLSGLRHSPDILQDPREYPPNCPSRKGDPPAWDRTLASIGTKPSSNRLKPSLR